MQNTAAGGWFYHTRKPSVANPLIGGMDYAGVVLACGPDVKQLKVGDRVCGIMKVAEYQGGTWAEQAIAPEKDVCPIEDDGISFVDAAAVTMGAFVCSDMEKHAAKALSGGGCRCLVLGASGALGTVMLQLLRKRKAHVTAVCSATNAETARKMGADEAVDYAAGPLAQQLAAAEKFGIVFDFVGGRGLERDAAAVLEPGGLYVTAVGDRQYVGDRQLSFGEFSKSVRYMLGKSCCGCGAKYRYVMSGAYPPLTSKVWKPAVVEAGARAAIAEEVPFAEAPLRQALQRVASHHPGGRVVINLERRE